MPELLIIYKNDRGEYVAVKDPDQIPEGAFSAVYVKYHSTAYE